MRLFFSKHELKLRRKRTIAAVVCMVIVLGVYWILTRPQKAAPEMPTVIVEPVIKDDVEIFGEYVGRIRAQQFVEVRARVEGYLEKMLFEEGKRVERNQPLFIINPDLYKEESGPVCDQSGPISCESRQSAGSVEKGRSTGIES